MIKINKTDRQFMASIIEDCRKTYVESYDNVIGKIEKDYLEAKLLLSIIEKSADKLPSERLVELENDKKELEIRHEQTLSSIKNKHTMNLDLNDRCYSYIEKEEDLTLAEADWIAKYFRKELTDAIDWFESSTKKENSHFNELSECRNAMLKEEVFGDTEQSLFELAQKKHSKILSDIKDEFEKYRQNFSRCIELAVVGSVA